MIFTRREVIPRDPDTLSSVTSSRENPWLESVLRDLASSLAPIPVTRLWTTCTRLKRREL